MNQNVLEIVYKTLSTAPPRSRKDYWADPLDQKPRTLATVLCEWVPQLRDENLASLPHLDDPADGLYRHPQGGGDDLSPDSLIITNSFQLLEDLLTTALVCYINKEHRPKTEEMQVVVRLAARALEFKEGPDKARWRMRHKICSFFTNHVFSADASAFPEEIVRHAFHQFILYWWAIPQKYKDELFSLTRGASIGLRGDFLLRAAEIVKDIFLMEQRTVLGADQAPAQRAVTSYHSVKGGTGKSTLALAHALALSEQCKGQDKVAILDLDMLNPSLLAMRIFAHAPSEFRFLEPILSSSGRPEAEDLYNAFTESTDGYPILFGTVFGPSRGSDPLNRMLGGDTGTWQIVVDNLRYAIKYLFDERACKHVILDNSSGFFATAIPSAIVTAEREGTFVLVSSLDAFDAGSIPIAQAAYDSLFEQRKRILVLNKCPEGAIEGYGQKGELVAVQAWCEALSRAGLEPVVDVSFEPARDDVVSYEDMESDLLFINTHKMLMERGNWDIEFVEHSRKLASMWAFTPSGRPINSLKDFANAMSTVPQIRRFLKRVMLK